MLLLVEKKSPKFFANVFILHAECLERLFTIRYAAYDRKELFEVSRGLLFDDAARRRL